jgi:hypothetical protein
LERFGTAPTQTSTFDFVSSTMVSSGKLVKGAPYSAEAVNETTQTLADGNRIVRRSSTNLYRDSEGRERREEPLHMGPATSPGEAARTVFITDPVAGASFTLDPNKRTARKMPMANRVYFRNDAGTGAGGSVGVATAAPRLVITQTQSDVHGDVTYHTEAGPATAATVPDGGGRGGTMVRRVSGDQPAPKVEQLGKMLFDGVEAEGTRTTRTIPAGQVGNERPIEIVSESWYSKDLQMTVMTKHSDPRNGETVYKLTNINRSEPLHTLFEVPPDYTSIEPAVRPQLKQKEMQ